MKQVFQSLKDGSVTLEDLPSPQMTGDLIKIQSMHSLISLGTESMLLKFGQSNYLQKIKQQPEKFQQILEKMKTDGVMATYEAVQSKLDQPIQLGYSNIGRVIEVGERVRGFKVGDLVASNGPHAEEVFVKPNLCAKVPEGVNPKEAAFTVVGAIALQGVRISEPTMGETFVVVGLGLVGLLTCKLLKANGCHVIGLDINEKKCDLASKMGIETYFLKESSKLLTAILEKYPQGVDGVLITAATSSNDPIEFAPKICRHRGRVTLVGVAGLNLSRDEFFRKEIKFQVSCSYGPGRYDPNYEEKSLDYPIGYVRWTEQRNLEAFLGLLQNKQIQVSDLITKNLNFSDIAGFYSDLENQGGEIGVLLNYTEKAEVSEKRITLLPLKSENQEKTLLAGIGTGDFSSKILYPLLAKKGGKFWGFASKKGQSSHFLSKKFKASVNTTDYKEFLSQDEVQAIIITTRHNSHAQMVLEGLKAGKTVFVEKPLAIRLDELKEIEEYVYLLGKEPPLFLGLNRRFSPPAKYIKERLTAKSVKSINYTINAGAINSNHWIHDPEVGGGRLKGEVVHFIDLLRFFVGFPITSASVQYSGSKKDNFIIQIHFEDESVGTINYFTNGTKSYPKERLELFNNGDVFVLDNFRKVSHFSSSGKKKTKRWWRQEKGFKEEVDHFLNFFGNQELPWVPFQEIREVSEWTIRLGDQIK